MKLSHITAFALGGAVSILALGAPRFINAESGAQIKACANKKTGTMRLLAKGSCNKRTETSISWNAQGLAGSPGPQGETGAKGDAGAKGEPGASAKTFHVVDAAGRDLGTALSIYDGGLTAAINFEGGVWTISSTSSTQYSIQGALNASSYFTDSACTKQLWWSPAGAISVPFARGSNTPTNQATEYAKPSGTPYLSTSVALLYSRTGTISNGVRACQAVLESDKNEIQGLYFVDVVAATPPTFTAPFVIVEK